MPLIGGEIGYRILRQFFARQPGTGDKPLTPGLEDFFGPRVWDAVRDQVVIDFGCGTGKHTIEMAARGARKAIGLDIREAMLETGRRAARTAGLDGRAEFVTRTEESADLIISVDAFEHFSDPAAILRAMRGALKPSGEVLVSFGPPWYHPYGAHLPLFPWGHLLFTEAALMRWRADWKRDGAQRFSEVDGGLNQMTIRRFCDLVEYSPFRLDALECLPIKGIRLPAGLGRELLTSAVRCRLLPRPGPPH